jgi:hypothetical protein
LEYPARVYLAMVVAVFIGFLGCSDTDTEKPTLVPEVPLEEVAGVDDTLEALKAREVASREHLNKYFELKETDPDAAFEALKTAASVLHDNHPKSDEYAKLLFDMDTAGVATPPQILAIDEILLKFAIDNHYGQELIQHQKEAIQETKERIKELKRDGIDPDEFTEPFIFDPTQ